MGGTACAPSSRRGTHWAFERGMVALPSFRQKDYSADSVVAIVRSDTVPGTVSPDSRQGFERVESLAESGEAEPGT